MQRKKTVGLSSAVMAGALLVTGVALSAHPDTIHGSSTRVTHVVLAADTAPTVNLDNCPALASGYRGGCVNQLQTELNNIDGANLPVDGFFGPATKAAVEVFQQEHGISPVDGIVGLQTKAVLDNPSSGSVPTPSLGASTGVPTSGTPTSSGGSSGSSGEDSGISGFLDSQGSSEADVVKGTGCGAVAFGAGALTAELGLFALIPAVSTGVACEVLASVPPAG
jgi:hypothetical protein